MIRSTSPKRVVVRTTHATYVATYNAEDLPVSILRLPPDVPAEVAEAEVVDVRFAEWELPNLADHECPHGRLATDREPCPECHAKKEVNMPPTKKQGYEAALREILAEGPRRTVEVNVELARRGLTLNNKSALVAARKALGVVKSRDARGWLMALPAAGATALASDLLDRAREAAVEAPPSEVLPATAFTAVADPGDVVCVVCHVASTARIAGVPLCPEHEDRWEDYWSRDVEAAL